MARDDFSRDARWGLETGSDRRRLGRRDTEDFGQADYSRDYAYDPDHRTGYRADDAYLSQAKDYGQADYSTDYTYDAEHGRGYRRFSGEERDNLRSDDRRPEDRRSWVDRAGAFLSGAPRRDDEVRPLRRRGPSDRVLWAVIVERLEDERRLDLRDVEVVVENAEVTLNGTVRRKEDKRRIEDVADIDGVRHVQNNLRVRDRGFF